MGKNDMENKFMEDLDAFLDGSYESEEIESKEYLELLELGKMLADKDFTSETGKKRVRYMIFNSVNENKGGNIMKKFINRNITAKVASLVLVAVLAVPFSQTAFAQNIVENVKKVFKLEHVEVFVDDFSDMEPQELPEELKGKIFDADGNEMTVLDPSYKGLYYNEDGESIVETESYKIAPSGESKKASENLIEKNPDKLNDYTRFEVKLPKYLPEGYAFDRAEFFKDENQVVENSKYISLYFTKEGSDEIIYMQQRFADEETAYSAGGLNVKEVKVGEVDGILYDNSLDWEGDGVIYAMTAKGLSESDMIRVAESIK